MTLNLQTLFDAHVLVTIARQHQAASASIGSGVAAAALGNDSNGGVSSIDSALAELTHKLRQRLDVVVYRSVAQPSTGPPVLPNISLIYCTGSFRRLSSVPLLPQLHVAQH